MDHILADCTQPIKYKRNILTFESSLRSTELFKPPHVNSTCRPWTRRIHPAHIVLVKQVVVAVTYLEILCGSEVDKTDPLPRSRT